MMAALAQLRRLSSGRPFRWFRPQSQSQSQSHASTRHVYTMTCADVSLLRENPSLFQYAPPAGCAYKYWILTPSARITPYLLPSTTLNYPPDYDHNRPPGCDFNHWVVAFGQLENIGPHSTRDDRIHAYVKILASVLGSEEEARQKIYSVSTVYYKAFGCNVSKDIASRIKGLPEVSTVFPDCYDDLETKSYGGEPFINGQAVPYDPKWYESYEPIYFYLVTLKYRQTCDSGPDSDSDSDEESSDRDYSDVVFVMSNGDDDKVGSTAKLISDETSSTNGSCEA